MRLQEAARPAGRGPPVPRKTTSIAAEVGEGVCAMLTPWTRNNAKIAANQEIMSCQHLHGSINATKHPRRETSKSEAGGRDRRLGSSSRSIVSLRLRERLTLFRNVEKIESLVETGGRKLR